MSADESARRCQPALRARRLAGIPAALLLMPISAFGQADPASQVENLSLLDDVFEAHSQRREGVNFWVERIRGLEIPGMSELPDGVGGGCVNCLVRKVEEVLNRGERSLRDQLMSVTEIMATFGIGAGAGARANMGLGMIYLQGVLNSQMAGIVPALPDAWIDPYRMFAAGGIMMAAGAQARADAERAIRTSNQRTQAESDQIGEVVSQLSDLGVVTTSDGRRARAFANTNLNFPMGDVGDGQTATLTGATLFVDASELVMVGHRFEGTMQEADGTSRPFFIEVLNSDYRHVPGCGLYEPYRHVMRMGGMLGEEEMAQMEEARAQLAEFEQQLASMPPAQRAMVEGMMGSQMDTVRNMAASGAIESVQEVEEIICNPDLRAMFSSVDPALELAQIQRDLVTLGYTPGNTDGVLDTLTEIAISQFQAERGMAVTGQPSTDLALALSSAVASRG